MSDRSRPCSGIRYRINRWPKSLLQWDLVQNPLVTAIAPTVGSGTESVGDGSRPYSGILYRIHCQLQWPVQWDPVRIPWVTAVAPTVGSGTESMGNRSRPYSGIGYRIHGWLQMPLQWDAVQNPWLTALAYRRLKVNDDVKLWLNVLGITGMSLCIGFSMKFMGTIVIWQTTCYKPRQFSEFKQV